MARRRRAAPRLDRRFPEPLFDAFIEAGREAGYPVTEDMNGYQQEGLGRMDMTTWRGRRWSAARGWLDPARRRPNLEVAANALATRVRFAGRRAAGVDYLERGRAHTADAAREVILAGGAINSPQLLLLSGVGPADELRSLGIDVVTDLPGSARTFRTTSRSTSSTPAPGRSPSTARSSPSEC